MSGINPTARAVLPNGTSDLPSQYKANLDAAINTLARPGFAFAPSAQDTPNMTVRLEAGAIQSGTTLTEVAAQSTGTIAAPTTNPRIDRVVIGRLTGAVSVVTGTPGASPSPPAIPAGKLPVARVLLTVGMAAITNSNLTDERNLNALGLGGAALLNAGSSVGNVPIIGSDGKLPTAILPTLVNNDAALMALFESGITANASSGPIPAGYRWLFRIDELATKTNATYDSVNHRYGNAGAISGTPSSITAGMLTLAGLAGPSASALVDGSTSNTSNDPSSAGVGAASITIDFGVAVNLGEIDINHNNGPTWATYYSDNGSSWTATGASCTPTTAGWYTMIHTIGLGAHRYWRIANTTVAPGGSGYIREIRAYEYTPTTNMTLKNTAITAGVAPGTIDLYLLHKAVDAMTLNTDLKVRASRDGGSNWTGYGTLAKVCDYDATYQLLKATMDFTSLPSGTSIQWEISTANTKSQLVRSVAALLQ